MSNLDHREGQDRMPLSRLARPRFLMPMLVMLTAVGAAAAPGLPATDWQSRVAPPVLDIWNSTQTAKHISARTRYDSKGRLQIDVAFDCSMAAPSAALVAAGMIIGTTVKVPPMCIVEGWAASTSVPALASLSSVNKIDLPKYAKAHPPIAPRSAAPAQGTAIAMATSGSPAIDGNGISIMNVDKYIQQTGVNGAGITIAVISDDVTSLTVIQGRGELPASVNVVQPNPNSTGNSNPPTDEGTMMLEEVYAVAPGANLAFCGPTTLVEYVSCLQNLLAAGATVISDDLTFPGTDVMSAPAQNTDAQAIENLLTANPNAMLFHAVGNDAQDYWQGAYNPTKNQNSWTCGSGGQTDVYFQQFIASAAYIAWQTYEGNSLFLASDLPAGQATANNFDVYVYDPALAQIVTCSASTSPTNAGTVGSTSYTVTNPITIPSLPYTYDIYIGTPDASLGGTYLKLIGTDDGGGIFSPLTSGAPGSPQDFAAGVITVGAVNGADGVGNAIEPYSDTGPLQFEAPAPSTLQAPLVVAPDAIYVDDTGTHFFVFASDGIFSGTSAASPNTAAVAVLLRSAFPSLTPSQITAALESGAAPLGGAVPNGTFGYGRVDAVGALAAIPAPTITPISSQTVIGGATSGPLAFTLGGTGSLTVQTNSDNTALVAATSQAINISPSTCGTSTTDCSVTISPTLGQVGTAHVTLSVVDAAKRSTSTQFTVTVTKPAPPTVTVTAGAAQTLAVGGKTIPVAFTVTGTQTLTVAVTSSNAALLPASAMTTTSGCGTSALTCNTTLAVGSGQSGSSTVTITATDPYLQTGTAIATVTVNAPPSKGGGSLELVSLIGLGGLLLLRSLKESPRP